MPDVLAEYIGLKQRFFHLGESVWFGYLSYGFVRLVKNRKLADGPERFPPPSLPWLA